MFTVEIGPNSYQVSYVDGAFVAKCQQPNGVGTEQGVITLAEIAFYDAQKKAEYMPTAGMIEFYTAREMGVSMEAPTMDGEPDFIY